MRDAGSSGNSSSSSSSSSAGDRDPTAGPLGDGDDDPAAKAAEARRAAREKKGIEFHQTTDQREAEDLRVAAFYRDDGNFRGAYERATDAVALVADDADAHLALAEAARRLGKLDEAETHYKKCLELDPVPKTKKAAEKALKEMTSGGCGCNGLFEGAVEEGGDAGGEWTGERLGAASFGRWGGRLGAAAGGLGRGFLGSGGCQVFGEVFFYVEVLAQVAERLFGERHLA